MRHLGETDPAAKAVVSRGYSDDAAITSNEKQGFKTLLMRPYDVAVFRVSDL